MRVDDDGLRNYTYFHILEDIVILHEGTTWTLKQGLLT